MTERYEAAFGDWYKSLADSDNPHAFTDVGLRDAFTAGWDARGNDWQRSDTGNFA